eukprot:CAMPEP_0115042020 /NCGR_PEP_ID=MMETSP0216-20121206/46018_1 /TAXON_ID=223996 /ORGANISM="Protocruzia adherens, Strain Boccale" /LENGTH=159 /DNA_ID=CAMNT_0002424057 /DNA_START=54 /DNA_END=533 /DNA_ORIENTATION=+
MSHHPVNENDLYHEVVPRQPSANKTTLLSATKTTPRVALGDLSNSKDIKESTRKSLMNSQIKLQLSRTPSFLISVDEKEVEENDEDGVEISYGHCKEQGLEEQDLITFMDKTLMDPPQESYLLNAVAALQSPERADHGRHVFNDLVADFSADIVLPIDE